MERLREWKKGMEMKSLRVNSGGKANVMQCQVNRVPSEDSGKYPCGVCRKGVELSNSIKCIVSWVGS